MLSAALLFTLLAAVLNLAAGEFLATHPNVGGWTGRSSPGHGGGAGDTGHNDLIRTPEGARFGRSLIVPEASDAPSGTVLGSVKFKVQLTMLSGWPRSTYQHWTISVSSIVPTAAGPPAQDERAWRALVAEAVAEAYSYYIYGGMPSEALRGDADFKVWRVRALLMNPIDRLWHAPAWPLGCLVIAGLTATVAGVWWWRRRWRSGECPACGYDLTGNTTGVCPECGGVAPKAIRLHQVKGG